jgi:transcriptional regulator with XRE-family HTH domain
VDVPVIGVARPDIELTLRQQVARRAFVRRVWLGLSQQEVADKAGISRNFVSAIERSAQGLDAWRLWALAEALGGTLDWLIAGPDEAVTAANPGRVTTRPPAAETPDALPATGSTRSPSTTPS